MKKLHTVSSLQPYLIRNQLRDIPKTIVFTNGCFDILHKGHVAYLEFCKSQGDKVIIGLNSDSSVRRIKGDGRPVNSQNDRAYVLSALKVVDYIIIFYEVTSLPLIQSISPDILVKGSDWNIEQVVGKEFVESHGGDVVLAPFVEGKSTTSTIDKIRSGSY